MLDGVDLANLSKYGTTVFAWDFNKITKVGILIQNFISARLMCWICAHQILDLETDFWISK